MQIGISTGLFYHKRIDYFLHKISSAGFKNIELWVGASGWGKETHFDYNREDEIMKIKDLVRAEGLEVPSLNAPFSENLDISSLDDIQRNVAISEIKKTIALCEVFEAKFVVVHPCVKTFPLTEMEFVKQKVDSVRKSLKSIVENAMLHNVKIAVENPSPHLLGGWLKDLFTLIEDLPPEYVGICLDVGHANLIGKATEFISQAGKRLFTLHISDNNGAYSEHLPPGDGNIDWKGVASALKDVGFSGTFMLEILGGSRFANPDEVLKKSFEAARKILEEGYVK